MDLRLFLFQTALASGAPSLPPFTASEDFDEASRKPLPVFATRRGRRDVEVGLLVVLGDVKEIFSPSLEGTVVPDAFAARNDLLTDTDLNDANFLILESVRRCPLPSAVVLVVSAFEASVSDPPLTLTSVDTTLESTCSASDLESSLP